MFFFFASFAFRTILTFIHSFSITIYNNLFPFKLKVIPVTIAYCHFIHEFKCTFTRTHTRVHTYFFYTISNKQKKNFYNNIYLVYLTFLSYLGLSSILYIYIYIYSEIYVYICALYVVGAS